ncbi:MAG TPA: hypothetical protein VEA69_21980 [Tepidisphaeraceae bacterium]|nr:hypothetical protein [Tepidisphaeraceae bacterium]
MTIRGDGASQFIFVDIGPRGAELYPGPNNTFILDPALDGQLLGETAFPRPDSAATAARRWLDGADLEQLRPAD